MTAVCSEGHMCFVLVFQSCTCGVSISVKLEKFGDCLMKTRKTSKYAKILLSSCQLPELIHANIKTHWLHEKEIRHVNDFYRVNLKLF